MVFEAAEAVILPVTPEIAALKAVHALFEYLSEVGFGRAQVDLRPQQRVRPRDPQAARRRELPRHQDVRRAAVRPVPLPEGVNEGVPLVTSSPRSTPSERLVRLSATAFGEEVVPVAGSTEERKSGLFRRRR